MIHLKKLISFALYLCCLACCDARKHYLHAAAADPMEVNVSVYYQSLDPDSGSKTKKEDLSLFILLSYS